MGVGLKSMRSFNCPGVCHGASIRKYRAIHGLYTKGFSPNNPVFEIGPFWKITIITPVTDFQIDDYITEGFFPFSSLSCVVQRPPLSDHSASWRLFRSQIIKPSSAVVSTPSTQ